MTIAQKYVVINDKEIKALFLFYQVTMARGVAAMLMLLPGCWAAQTPMLPSIPFTTLKPTYSIALISRLDFGPFGS